MMRIGSLVAFGLAGVLIPCAANGCGGSEPIRCSATEQGADLTNATLTLDKTMNGGFVALAQTVRDLRALADRTQIDVVNACRSIAIDLGEDPTPATKSGDDIARYWCTKANARLGATGLVVKITSPPARCETSVQDWLDCTSRCDPSVTCDPMTSPPTCSGGTLVLLCQADCDLQDRPIECEGQCTGMCTGTCDGMVTNAVSCPGVCIGMCAGRCSPPMGATSVKCSGKCSGPFVPLICKGGRLESGGCKVNALCETACSVGASVRAQCRVEIRLDVTGTSPQLPIVRATLERNLAAIAIATQARAKHHADAVQAIAGATGTIVAAGKLDKLGASCMGTIVDSLAATSSSFSTTLGAASVVGLL
jgi:hypothetical protein